MRFSVRLRIGSEGQRIAVCGWVSESINSISIYVVKHPVRLAYRVIVGLLLARWLIENIQYPFTQEPWCMISIGTGQKLNIQGGWTYIHAFHSNKPSFGTFWTLKILNLHPELNLQPWHLQQGSCVLGSPLNIRSKAQDRKLALSLYKVKLKVRNAKMQLLYTAELFSH